jgi:hypothetical protein
MKNKQINCLVIDFIEITVLITRNAIREVFLPYYMMSSKLSGYGVFSLARNNKHSGLLYIVQRIPYVHIKGKQAIAGSTRIRARKNYLLTPRPYSTLFVLFYNRFGSHAEGQVPSQAGDGHMHVREDRRQSFAVDFSHATINR